MCNYYVCKITIIHLRSTTVLVVFGVGKNLQAYIARVGGNTGYVWFRPQPGSVTVKTESVTNTCA